MISSSYGFAMMASLLETCWNFGGFIGPGSKLRTGNFARLQQGDGLN